MSADDVTVRDIDAAADTVADAAVEALGEPLKKLRKVCGRAVALLEQYSRETKRVMPMARAALGKGFLSDLETAARAIPPARCDAVRAARSIASAMVHRELALRGTIHCNANTSSID